jgi:peptidoglycan/LPS O-acetylase OafA/YrhL
LLPSPLATYGCSRWRAVCPGWGTSVSAAYLLHFPLQIVAALLADKFLPGRAVFYQPWSLLLFFAVLIGSSLLCHYGFERPVQRWIRRRTVGHNKVAAMAR